MKDLKNNGILILFLLVSFYSCSLFQPSYKVLMKNDVGIEVLIDRSRVNVSCEDASGDDKIHVLLIHVLNEKKLVDDYIYGMAYPKAVCHDFKAEIERVIKNGNQIYLGAHGDGKIDAKDYGHKYFFQDFGKFPSSRVSYAFQVIKNEKGQCYGFASGSEKDAPCLKAGVDFLVGSPVSGY